MKRQAACIICQQNVIGSRFPSQNDRKNMSAKPRTGANTAKNKAIVLLREAILSGEFKGGQALFQEELAERFGVSLTPVREALTQLEHDGFVVIYPNRGTIVAPLSSDEALETFELRLFIETVALRSAIPVMTDQDIARSRLFLDYSSDVQPSERIRNGLAFHYALCEPCNKAQTLRMLRGLHKVSERYLRAFYIASPDLYIDTTRCEHEAIMELCLQRKVDETLAILTDHLRATFNALADHFDASNGRQFRRDHVTVGM
jgi:DNA-binding GntR family transcriptional regulator